jgi:general secretion pathway protein I
MPGPSVPRRACGNAAARAQAGFTLLEVLVAFAVLAIAIVSLIELTSQGLRLLKRSGDHQQAVELADQIAKEAEIDQDADSEVVDTGETGRFSWERRVARRVLPQEDELRPVAPGKEWPGLYAVSVTVRWGNQAVELVTLRAPSEVSSATAPTPPSAAPDGDAAAPRRGAAPSSGESGSEGSRGGRRGTALPSPGAGRR